MNANYCCEIKNNIEMRVASNQANIQPKEMDWIEKALRDITNSNSSLKVEDRITRQLNTLYAFTSDQVVRLVNILQQEIQKKSSDAHIEKQLCQAVADLTCQKNIPIDRFIQESADKNFAIKVTVQQVKQGKLSPFKAAERLLHCGVVSNSPEIQGAMIEIAKLAIQQYGWGFSENIKKFGIDASMQEGQHKLIEIAKLAAQKNGGDTSAYIQNYGIDSNKPEGRQALIEIAKLAAQQSGEGISMHIQNYGIDVSTSDGREALVEIAKLAAQQSGEGTSRFIKNYGIDVSTSEGRQALVEIAKLAAQQSGEGISMHIKNYGIDASKPEGQQALTDIAKLAAEQCGGGTSRFIKNYSIDVSTSDGRQALIEIAKVAAQKSGEGISMHIQNYGIDASKPEGQQALTDIAKLAAQQSGEGISMHIQKYGIDASKPEGQQALTDIAKLAAEQCGRGTSRFIKNYSIDATTTKGQLVLIEIAKLAAKQCGREISIYIQNYGIDASKPEGLKALIEIAKSVAQQDGKLTSMFIKNYGIDGSTLEGQQVLIEIAKLAAQEDIWGTSQNIKNYGIDVSKPMGNLTMIEMAKFVAQQDGEFISKIIKNYGIDASTPDGQQVLIEIAKLAAQQNGRGTSKFIMNYSIDASTTKGQQALIEIAKLAAQEDGWGTSQNIKNYGIDAFTQEGQQALIEIAKLAAQQNGEGVSMHIQKYGIDASTQKGQLVLIEIAKLAAQQNAIAILKNLSNYSLDTKSVEGKQRYLELIQFLFICVVKQFSSFKYSDFQENFEVYSKICNENGIDSYRINIYQFEASLEQLKSGDLPGALKKSVRIAVALFEMNTDQLLWVHDRVFSIKNKDEQKEFLEQWMSLCALCASREDLKQLFKQNGQLFEGLFQLSPALRIRFIQEVIVASLDSKSLFVERLKAEILRESCVVQKIAVLPRDLRMAVAEVFLRGFHDSQAERVKHLRESVSEVVHAQLACFMLGAFAAQGADVYLKVMAAIAKDRNLRDAKYQQPLLAALVAIEKSSLDDDKKIKLLNDLFSVKDVEERLQGLKLITDILNFKGESYLHVTSDLATLKAVVERLFIDKCKVKLENFGALYHISVGKWRSKEALLTYAGKHVGDPKALPYFQCFLTGVLKGDFLQNRYAVENNPHLDQIKKSHPKVFEAWQKSISLTPAEIASKDSIKKNPIESRVVENLKQAVENRHLGLEQQETLFPVLSACIGKWDSLDEPLKHIKKDLEPLSNRPLKPEESQQKQQLQLQKVLLELVKDPKDVENKLNVLKGIKIKGFEKILGPFYQDLEDAVQMLRSSQRSSSDEMTMIDSDDPNHFLLMGTEVLGSCQNVNGSASLNVGLLGYALDGKHRLALVCDSSSKILARSVLRLLIDAKGHPVLFQEKVYVADASPEYPSLLRKIALKKAELLGIPLVVSPSDFENEQAQPYAFAIEAKDKPVPFEYVDALAGLQSGAYKIVGSLRIDQNT